MMSIEEFGEKLQADLDKKLVGPRVLLDNRLPAPGQDPRNIARQTATGNVSHSPDYTLDPVVRKNCPDAADINLRRLEQLIP